MCYPLKNHGKRLEPRIPQSQWWAIEHRHRRPRGPGHPRAPKRRRGRIGHPPPRHPNGWNLGCPPWAAQTAGGGRGANGQSGKTFSSLTRHRTRTTNAGSRFHGEYGTLGASQRQIRSDPGPFRANIIAESLRQVFPLTLGRCCGASRGVLVVGLGVVVL